MTYEFEARLRADVAERLKKFEDPLIGEMIRWIAKHELWAACEAVGMVKGGRATITGPKEYNKRMLGLLQDALK